MLKVIIKNLYNIQTHGASFKNIEDANKWISKQIELKSWGKTAGNYPLSKLTNSELMTEISRQERNEFGQLLIDPLIQIPDQFSIEIIDITQEEIKRQIEQDGLKRQQIGSQIMAKVFRINTQKNLSIEQFELLMNDIQMARLERLIWNGSLGTAKLLIQNMNNTFFTNDEKNEILELLGDY